MRVVLPWVLVVLTGCLGEDRFVSAVAESMCERHQACQPAEFDTLFASRRRCELSVEQSMGFIREGARSLQCAWDRAEAQRCLDHLESVPCSEFDVAQLLERCSRAWVCP